MTDWTAGYVADINYTYGYYPELNPLHTQLAFLETGLTPSKTTTACELGFGQGLSTNLHAAASLTEWYGTDFNPVQAAFAQELATASGTNAKLYDEAFSDFANRSDLPDFDYIGLHGIWSWISDTNRTAIVEFIRRKLKVGGVLYISYNTLPGWGTFAPMRYLLTEHATRLGASGQPIVERIDNALAFSEQLLALNPGYARANPQVAERIAKIKTQDRHYLAHEYFNRDWEPMHFSTMADWLRTAKLDYACSAHYPDHIPALNLNEEQQTFLATIPDPLLRETVLDFITNQQFRRDYWVKGARHLSTIAQVKAWREQSVILLTPAADIPLKAKGSLGEIGLNEAIYTPLIQQLSGHKTKTIGHLERALQAQGISLAQLIQAVVILAGTSHLASVNSETVIQRTRKTSQKLNTYLIQKTLDGSGVGHLSSAVTGGGVSVNRIEQLFLVARIQGKKQPGEWVDFVWSQLSLQNQRLTKEGQALQTEEENLAELHQQAMNFMEKRLPLLRALQVC